MSRTPVHAAPKTRNAQIGAFALSWILMAAALGSCAVAQTAAQTQSSASPPVASFPADAKKTSAAPAPTTAAVVVTDPRQAQILADSAKLLKLSQELKAEVAKTNKDTLSLAVIKKAEEVEKLAKTLKEEMNKAK